MDDRAKALAEWYGGDESFGNYTFQNFQAVEGTEKALAAVNSLKLKQVPGLYLFGPVGSGKSHLMKALWGHLLTNKMQNFADGADSSWTFRWISMSYFLERLREKDYKAKDRAMKVDMLFIDDFGAAPKTEWAIDQVFQLIDYRYERKLQTFITSNHNLDEVAKNFSERVSSRIAGFCVPVMMKAKDFRKEEELKTNMGKLISMNNKGGAQ